MGTELRAALVSVEYADLLALTLPWNRHHFSEVLIVTTPDDAATHAVALEHNCRLYMTRAFYDDKAAFNKWKALEEGLNRFGRRGWLCLMDADILWPKDAPLGDLEIGTLYGAARYVRQQTGDLLTNGLPAESEWKQYPVHPNLAEWAGYTQVFHADDPALGRSPWHEINWRHAGGADSLFQRKWRAEQKRRFPWKCLHLGPCGMNWFGRATAYLDGAKPTEMADRMNHTLTMQEHRRAARKQGLTEPEIWKREKLQ